MDTVRSSMAEPTGQAPPRFLIRRDRDLEPVSPAALLEALDRGQLTLDTPVWVSATRPPRPLRAFLRDLVWLEWQEAQAARAPIELFGAPVVSRAFSQAFAHAAVGMVISDLSGRILHSNAAFAGLLGVTVDELEGVLVGDISVADDLAAERVQAQSLLQGKVRNYQILKRFRAQDGTTIPCLVAISMVRGELGAPRFVVATVVDYRDELALIELRAKGAETQAVQTLARGVAHDFNNTLMVIHGAASNLMDDPGLTDHDSLAAITQATRLASELTARLRALSAAGVGALGPVDLGAAVRAREAFLRGLVGTGCRLVLRLPAEPVVVQADEAAVDQLLLNLVHNAAAACGAGGEVRVRLVPLPEGGLLQVEDDGEGMAPEVRRRVTEPYFTQRPGGTGLGMAIVAATLARVGGTMEIDSAPGEGTCCTLWLPPAR